MTTKPARSIRWANIERLRILAMLEIIGFHCATERTLFFGGLGLPTFLLLANLFNCTVSDKRGFKQFTRDKFNRLFWPWLYWCAVYAAVRIFFAFREGVPLGDVFDPLMLLYGTHHHLWFIPFALLSGLLAGYLQARTAHLDHRAVIAVAAGAGVLTLFVCAYAQSRHHLPMPAPQYIYSLASPLLGFTLGRTILIESRELRRKARVMLCVGAAVCAVIALLLPVELFAVRYCVSAILITVALAWPGDNDWLTITLTPLLLGVYLIHPFFIRFTKGSQLLDTHIVLYALVVFILSATAIALMRKTPLRRLT